MEGPNLTAVSVPRKLKIHRALLSGFERGRIMGQEENRAVVRDPGQSRV